MEACLAAAREVVREVAAKVGVATEVAGLEAAEVTAG